MVPGFIKAGGIYHSYLVSKGGSTLKMFYFYFFKQTFLVKGVGVGGPDPRKTPLDPPLGSYLPIKFNYRLYNGVS